MKIAPLIAEREVLAKLKAGDVRAFNTLYAHYSLRLYGNIMKMVKDAAIADDIHQDLFAKIWQKREQIDLDKSFKSFLFTCAKYQVYDYLKRVDIERQVHNYISVKDSELYSHVEEELVFKETDDYYQMIIEQLPPQCRNVFHLVKEQGLSYEEAAQEMGISILTVRNHLAKAMRIIREQMKIYTLTVLLSYGTAYLL